ncbi:CHASE2 domain-containing protein [Novosphingobium pituita]|uniref:histidine kinase n=1 Tax=Novosphingobium pituita TaxID=3056842 RepID=A0ABQ6P5R3_9SPHN|nr:CHASE2 domain-containing protein [Novosphingobium sp. IK01]GMM60215.1 CHASE2 domain-containing protein [Novosphingobium sp. IK01]
MRFGPSVRLRSQWWAIALLASLLVIVLTVDRTLLRLDNAVYDHLLQITPAGLSPGRSAASSSSSPSSPMLVGLDDESIERLGRWPWSRSVHAALIERLQQAGARAIAYDVLFTEPGDPDDDARLAAALGRASAGGTPVFLPMLRASGDGAGAMPITPLRAAAAGVGYATVEPDADGVVRSATILLPRQGAGAAVSAGEAPDRHLMALLARSQGNADVRARTDRPGARRIPLAQGGADHPAVSAAAVLAGEVPPELLRGRVVLVGATATGLASRYPVPGGPVVSGLEIEAGLYQALVSGHMISQAGLVASLALALVPLWLLMGALGPWRPFPALAVFTLAVGLVLVISALGLMVCHVWLPPGAALAGLAVAYPLWGWRQLAVTEQFLRGELQRLDAEPALLPRAARDDAARSRGVGGTLALMQAAIARNREMRHFVADRLDQLPDPTLVAGLDGGIVMANAAAQRLFAGMGINLDTGPMLPVDALPDVQALLSCFRRSGSGEAIAFPPEGPGPHTLEVQRDQAHFFLLGMAGQTSAEGAHAGWVIRLVDISEAKAVQRQRDDVVQLLTHDMRSPQASILAVLETAASDHIHPLEREAIRLYAERTLRLADGFVQLARAENLDYRLEEIGLPDMLIDAIDDLWPQSRAKAIQIVTAGDMAGDEPMVVLGERSLLTRALANVIGNAIKYSPENTTITCTLTRDTHVDGSIWGRVIIADEGVGMDEDLRARMFERFHRGPVGLGPKTGGAGLGLSFVHTVMVRHHGTIACRSTPGQGTAFELSLPLLAFR